MVILKNFPYSSVLFRLAIHHDPVFRELTRLTKYGSDAQSPTRYHKKMEELVVSLGLFQVGNLK